MKLTTSSIVNRRTSSRLSVDAIFSLLPTVLFAFSFGASLTNISSTNAQNGGENDRCAGPANTRVFPQPAIPALLAHLLVR